MSKSASTTDLARSQGLPQPYQTGRLWGGTQQICFNMHHASDKVWQPLLYTSINLQHLTTSSTLLTVILAFYFSQEKKKKNQPRGLVQIWNNTTNHPSSVAAKYPALSMTFLSEYLNLCMRCHLFSYSSRSLH